MNMTIFNADQCFVRPEVIPLWSPIDPFISSPTNGVYPYIWECVRMNFVDFLTDLLPGDD